MLVPGTRVALLRVVTSSHRHAQIVPVSDNFVQNQMTCFQNNGSAGSTTTIQSIIPDLSLFTVWHVIATIYI